MVIDKKQLGTEKLLQQAMNVYKGKKLLVALFAICIGMSANGQTQNNYKKSRTQNNYKKSRTQKTSISKQRKNTRKKVRSKKRNKESIRSGYKAYQRGDYRKASRLLKKNLRKRAILFKLVAISDYRIGKKSSAKKNIKRALDLNPKLKLTRADRRIRGFSRLFKKVKRSLSRDKYDQAFPEMDIRVTKSYSNEYDYYPFGMGQFEQEKNALGFAFAGGQLGGLLLFIKRNLDSNAAKKDAEERTQIQVGSARTAFEDDDFIAYLEENDRYIDKLSKESLLGLAIFAGSYALGVYDAANNKSYGSSGSGWSWEGGSSRKERSYPPKELRGKELQPSAAHKYATLMPSNELSEKTHSQWSVDIRPQNTGVSAILNWKTQF